MPTVALIGPDGAGKTTLAQGLAGALGPRAAYLYMGINLEASNVLLPTTRLVLEIKRRRGGRPDLSTPRDAAHELSGGSGAESGTPPGGAAAAAKSTVRMVNQVAEEWFRQAIAWYHQLRGRVVVFDRHFFVDYHAYDVARRRDRRQPLARRLHGLMLARLYPKPDLVVMLDAPAEVFLERKGEGTLGSIERRRREYLALREDLPRFAVVDASRQPQAILDDLLAVVRETFALGAPA